MNNLNAKVEKRISEKSGKEYYVVTIKLTPTYEKSVFLDKAEVELLKSLKVVA